MEEIKGYICSKCGFAFLDSDKALKCCKCSTCGKELDNNFKGQDRCRPCTDFIEVTKERARAEKVRSVPYTDGMVLHDNEGNFLWDLDEVYTYVDSISEDEEKPEWFFVAKKVRGIDINICSVVHQHIEDRHYEDAVEEIKNIELLEDFMKQWSGLQEHIVSADAETKQKVLLIDIPI